MREGFLPGLGVFAKLSAGLRGAREAFCHVLVANERRTRTKRQRKRQIATPLVGRSRALHSQRVFGGSVASQPTTRLLTVADGAFQPAGATSRMAGAQTQSLDLHFLSKSSAKVAAFAVRVCHGRCVEYHYVEKKTASRSLRTSSRLTLLASRPRVIALVMCAGLPTHVRLPQRNSLMDLCGCCQRLSLIPTQLRPSSPLQSPSVLI